MELRFWGANMQKVNFKIIGYSLILIVTVVINIAILKFHITTFWFLLPFSLIMVCAIAGGIIEIKKSQRLRRKEMHRWLNYKRSQDFLRKWGQ